jgi:hypothetical protein
VAHRPSRVGVALANSISCRVGVGEAKIVVSVGHDVVPPMRVATSVNAVGRVR